jgi:tetratricopeptide (TPR) repeat protein
VWRNDESLWKDIIQKSPENARALMNYGLSRMSAGDYFESEYYFRKALSLWPNWPYLHINMGILKDAQGQTAEAEQWFQSAIARGGNNPEPYYYYSRFLYGKGKKIDAITYLQTAIKISSAHINSRDLLMAIYAETEQWDLLRDLANSTLQIVPNEPGALQYLEMSQNKKSVVDIQAEAVEKNPTAEGYLAVSVTCYQRGEYQKCIDYCNKALKIKPDFADAYNNMCSAYNSMQMWDEGVKACEAAIKINPNYELAKNNLNWALSGKKKTSQ